MKKYLLLFIMFLFLPLKVFAAANWGQYVTNYPTQLYFRDCSGQSCTINIGSAIHEFDLNENGMTRFYHVSGTMRFSAGGSGGMVIYSVASGLNPSTLYSATLYTCSQGMTMPTSIFNYEFYIGSDVNTIAQRNNHGYDRFLFTGTALNESPYVRMVGPNVADSLTYTACYSRTILFNPTNNSRFIGMSMKANTSSSGSIVIIGYDLEALGSVNNLTSQDISNAIQHSGLATANSVTQVQSSINEVKQEISGMQQEQQQTNEKLDELNDNITNDNVDSSSSTIENLQSQIATNNVISDLLLLPVTLYQKIINSLNGSCSPFNLGSLYNHNLTLPCINLENYLGSTIFTTIDLIISGLFVLTIRKKFVDIFNNMTNLKNGGNEVE